MGGTEGSNLLSSSAESANYQFRSRQAASAVFPNRSTRFTSPNLASAHRVFGATLIFSGHPREGLVALERSIRLDPHAADLAAQGYRLNTLALGHYFCGEYEAAVEAAKRAIRSDPNYPNAYRWLAAALGQLGRSAEAKEALEKAMAVGPVSFDMYVRQRVPWHRPEDYAHMREGLRKAGWRGT